MRLGDIVDEANLRIRDFVHQRGNACLKPGTGYYSTPFRGNLFGQVESAAVMQRLPTRGVDVFWLGTNPCVPQSLEYILSPPKDAGHFPGFERQVESGFFGSSRWDSNGKPIPDMNPIERPKHGWTVYRDVLSGIARLDCVAMANFIPWGSQNTKAFVTELDAANRPLLLRALEFADELNNEIVRTLAPRLVVVPISLGRNRSLDDVWPLGFTLNAAISVKKHAVALPEGTFNCFTATCRRGNLTVPTVFLRHPASLRLTRDSKKRVVDELGMSRRMLNLG